MPNPAAAESSSPGNNADDIDARIAALAAPDPEAAAADDIRDGLGSEGGTDRAESTAADPSAETAELEEFLTAGLLRGIEWVYESRATVAGEHWKLDADDLAKIEPPAARVVAKWAPKIARFVPSIAWRCKEELALIVIVWRLTAVRVKIDQAMPPAENPPDGQAGPSVDR